MIQRSDYWKTGARFLLITALLLGCYYLFLVNSVMGLELMFVMLAGLGSWLIHNFYSQPRKVAPRLAIDSQKLERLRELHRLGDG